LLQITRVIGGELGLQGAETAETNGISLMTQVAACRPGEDDRYTVANASNRAIVFGDGWVG
jgi:hypothetical protein